MKCDAWHEREVSQNEGREKARNVSNIEKVFEGCFNEIIWHELMNEVAQVAPVPKSDRCSIS
jgi:hypothetical protein